MERITLIIIISLVLMSIILIYITTKPKTSISNKFLDRSDLMLRGYFIAFSIMMSYILFDQAYKEDRVKITLETTENAWIKLNEKIGDNASKCPYFIDTLYLPAKKLILEPDYNKNKKHKPENDDWIVVNYLCHTCYQAFQYFLISNELEDNDEEGWVGSFLNVVVSPILQDYWEQVKNDYSENTRVFTDLMIEGVKKIPPKSEEDIKKIIQYVVKDKRFVEIKNKIEAKRA